ncbi:MAG: glycerophosphodiester phosphodiesterase family protein, partial [Henriciella sp.]|uniref:glycerophosphodiester phosphodiesterase family protein n=1 Tax=Henriciella sp. TaxID=1968823 RepID=UPI003C77FB35
TLFLMHDRSLGRTTTGSGAVAGTDWAEIARMRLVDNDGTVTAFTPPTLDEALVWARQTGAILELDRKETTSFRNILEKVREAGAENNVILISYTDEEALMIAELAPDVMMTAGIGNRDHEAAMIEAGLDPERLIAWTGTRRPSPGKWRGLASKDIESAFGTLGRAGERLDDQYWADGDPSEYEDLVEAGLVMLATDTPYRLMELEGTIGGAVDRANQACFIKAE